MEIKKIGMPGDNDSPPYERGIEAIHDGWRLFQSSQLEQHPKGDEYRTGYLKYEFFFEKINEKKKRKNFLLTDNQMAEFVSKGYLIFENIIDNKTNKNF